MLGRKLTKAVTIARHSPSIAATCVRAMTNRFAHKPQLDRAPAFVIGCGHSGTTVLLRILGAHSRIFSVPFESNLGTRSGPSARLLMKYFDLCTLAQNKVRWVEKTPNHINCIGRLWELAPEAKVILILRDGRDVACSLRNRFGDLRGGIERWINDNGSGKRYWRHRDVHVLRYEELVEDFQSTVTSILHFIGEEYEPGIEDYHQTPANHRARVAERPQEVSGKDHGRLREWQTSQPIFDGRGKWKSMTDDEKGLFKKLAGEMLIEYGYVENNDW